MKNDKLFTLGKLLAIIAILLVIIILAIFSALSIRHKILENRVILKASNIKSAAIVYAQKQNNIFNDTAVASCSDYADVEGFDAYKDMTNCVVITGSDLIDGKFLEYEDRTSDRKPAIFNDLTKENMLDDLIVLYESNKKIYSFMPKYDE
jgi:hypothetical protein